MIIVLTVRISMLIKYVVDGDHGVVDLHLVDVGRVVLVHDGRLIQARELHIVVAVCALYLSHNFHRQPLFTAGQI